METIPPNKHRKKKRNAEVILSTINMSMLKYISCGKRKKEKKSSRKVMRCDNYLKNEFHFFLCLSKCKLH